MNNLIRIPVTNVYTPETYNKIEPGSVIISIPRVKFWRVIDRTDTTLSIIPYSGGFRYDFDTKKSSQKFGLIERPELIPERLYP